MQVLPSALMVALSGKCDRELLSLLLTFPEDQQAEAAVTELCGLPGSEVFTLIMILTWNLDLCAFVYKVRGRGFPWGTQLWQRSCFVALPRGAQGWAVVLLLYR